jgi:hypothetical protein
MKLLRAEVKQTSRGWRVNFFKAGYLIREVIVPEFARNFEDNHSAIAYAIMWNDAIRS